MCLYIYIYILIILIILIDLPGSFLQLNSAPSELSDSDSDLKLS